MTDEDRTTVPEVTPADERPSTARSRLACPSCGSSRTQPFPHAGPAARVNMKCLDCGHLFKDRDLRR